MTTIDAPATTVAVELTDLVDTYLGAWAEEDPARRAEVIRGCWTETGCIVDPPLDGYGHAGIDALFAAFQNHYPGCAFVRTSEVDAHHDVFRVTWELRAGDGTTVLSGMDVGNLSPDGRIARITGFFGDVHHVGDRGGR